MAVLCILTCGTRTGAGGLRQTRGVTVGSWRTTSPYPSGAIETRLAQDLQKTGGLIEGHILAKAIISIGACS